MPTVDTLLSFALASLILSLSPGPSNLYIMARSLSQGFNNGAMAALGLAGGSLIYVLVTAWGLAVLFQSQPLLVILIQGGGALYLMYLGIQHWQSQAIALPNAPLPTRSGRQILRQSLLVELTNPKTALFFLAFLPQFVRQPNADATSHFLVLGGLYAIIALLCDLSVAALSSQLRTWLQSHPSFPAWQERVTGTILLGLGSYLVIATIADAM